MTQGIMTDWVTTGLTALVIFVATVVHGITGFGYAQVSMGLLPLFRNPGAASIIFTVTAIFSNGRVWWSVRDDFDWRRWVVPVIGLALGLPPGIYVFSAFNKTQLRAAIGGVLVLAVVLIASMRQIDTVTNWIEDSDLKPGWKTGVTAGFLSGVFGGAVAIPGPPMIVYGAFMAAGGFWTDREMKAVFTAFFGTLMVYRVATLGLTGTLSLPLLIDAAIALPGIFIGAWVGVKIFNRVPETVFGWLVLVLLTVNAAVLLFTSIPDL